MPSRQLHPKECSISTARLPLWYVIGSLISRSAFHSLALPRFSAKSWPETRPRLSRQARYVRKIAPSAEAVPLSYDLPMSTPVLSGVLGFEEARRVVEEQATLVRAVGTEAVDLLASAGRVLAESIVADRDLPP